MNSLSWMEQAACRGLTDEFFPEPVNGSRRSGPNADLRRDYAAAKAVCDSCPVRDDCLEYAVLLPWVHVQGMLAGLRPSQLRELRRARRRSAA